MFALTDLDAFRSAGEYATYIADLEGRLKELDDSRPGQPLGDDERAEFAEIVKIKEEAITRKTEVEARTAVLARNVTDAGRAVPASPRIGMPQVAKARRVPEDIFALEQYRNLSGSEDQLLQAYRDGAMFAVDRALYPNPQSVDSVEKEHLAKLLDFADQPCASNPSRELSRRVIATGSPVYLRAFTKYLQGRPLSPDEQRAVAPWTVQTDATGGYMVPFYFDPTLLHVGAWTATNPYRQACTVKTIVGTDTFHGSTSAAFTVTRAAEAAASTEGLGAIAQISAIVAKVHGMGTFSNELLQDRPDLTSEIASLIAEAKDTEEESTFSVGIGDAVGAGYNPIGMLAAGATSGAFTSLTTAGSTTLAATDADLVEAALPIRHRKGAAWFMGRASIRQWQALETTTGKLFGGQYYQRVDNPDNNATGNTGLRMLGYPVWETPSGLSGTTAGLIQSALVNPSRFYIIERAGMTVETVPHMFDATTGYPTGNRGIYAWWRNTAKPADVNAGRRLAIKA
jgi:HK97 family phage major capsid protein